MKDKDDLAMFWVDLRLTNGKRCVIGTTLPWSVLEGAEYIMTDRPEYLIKKGKIINLGNDMTMAKVEVEVELSNGQRCLTHDTVPLDVFKGGDKFLDAISGKMAEVGGY